MSDTTSFAASVTEAVTQETGKVRVLTGKQSLTIVQSLFIKFLVAAVFTLFVWIYLDKTSSLNKKAPKQKQPKYDETIPTAASRSSTRFINGDVKQRQARKT